MERGQTGTTYHLSPPKGHTVRDIVRQVCDLMGRRFEEATVSVGERLGQDAAYVIDSSLAHATLGWVPTVALEEGLREVVEWIERNWDEIRNLPHEYIHQP